VKSRDPTGAVTPEEQAGARDYLRRALGWSRPLAGYGGLWGRVTPAGHLWDRLDLEEGPRKGPLFLPDREG
jgi:hypothetical protein